MRPGVTGIRVPFRACSLPARYKRKAIRRCRILALNFGFSHAESLREQLTNRFDGDIAHLRFDEILQHMSCVGEGNIRAGQRGVGQETGERPLQRERIGPILCNVERHIRWERYFHLLRDLQHDGDSCFKVGVLRPVGNTLLHHMTSSSPAEDCTAIYIHNHVNECYGLITETEGGPPSSYPPLAPHPCVYLNYRGSVPVGFPNEVYIQISGPCIRNVLFFTMFRANCAVNMMSEFMEQHVAEDYVFYERNRERPFLRPLDDLIHSHFDIRQ